MTIEFETQYAVGQNEVKNYHTEQLRSAFLTPDLFQLGKIKLVYTHYDRLVIGGVVPLSEPLPLESIEPLKSKHFLDRRELGIINTGGPGLVLVDREEHLIANKEALYIGAGKQNIVFFSLNEKSPARFYLNSAPAHCPYPTTKIDKSNVNVLELGASETSNERTIFPLIVNETVQTCQLQMGLTCLKPGSVWNTMPAHLHDRRMEAYLYFELANDQAVSHFMGEPLETRHIWVKNEQVVVSPSWSIHSGVGTSHYSFIWGMAGENQDYNDMDACLPTELK